MFWNNMIDASKYCQLYDYDASNNAIYFWECLPWDSLKTTEPLFRIKKFTYDISGNMTLWNYADWNIVMDNVWDDRAILSYS